MSQKCAYKRSISANLSISHPSFPRLTTYTQWAQMSASSVRSGNGKSYLHKFTAKMSIQSRHDVPHHPWHKKKILGYHTPSFYRGYDQGSQCTVQNPIGPWCHETCLKPLQDSLDAFGCTEVPRTFCPNLAADPKCPAARWAEST